MTTQRLYKVTIVNPDATGGLSVRLPLPRTEAEVEALRAKYGDIKAIPVAPDPPKHEPKLDDFHEALAALIRLYRASEAKGDVGLAKRAENAVAELLGAQKHLRDDRGQPVGGGHSNPAPHRPKLPTLVGIGRPDRVR